MAKIVYQLIADDSQAVKKVDELIAKLEGGAVRVSSKMDTAGASAGKVGDQFARSLGSMITGWFTVEAAIGAAKKTLEAFNAERKRGATALEEQEKPLAKLALQAENQADFNRMMQAAKETSRTTGATMEQAATLQAVLNKTGLEQDRGTFASLFKFGEDPADFVRGTAALQKSFGAKETGGAKGMVNKFLAAANKSVGAKDLAGAAVKAADWTTGLGGSDEELLAALAVGAKSEPSVDDAGSKLGAFAKLAQQKGWTGGGLLGAMGKAQAATRGMSDAQRVQFLGKGFQGFAALQEQQGDIRAQAAMLGEVQAGKRPGRLERAEQIFGATPELAAVAEKARAKAAADISLGGELGITHERIGAASERIAGNVGLNRFDRLTSQVLAKAGATIGGGLGEGIAGAAEFGNQAIAEREQAFRGAVVGLLRRLTGNTDGMLTTPAGAEAANAR